MSKADDLAVIDEQIDAISARARRLRRNLLVALGPIKDAKSTADADLSVALLDLSDLAGLGAQVRELLSEAAQAVGGIAAGDLI